MKQASLIQLLILSLGGFFFSCERSIVIERSEKIVPDSQEIIDQRRLYFFLAKDGVYKGINSLTDNLEISRMYHMDFSHRFKNPIDTSHSPEGAIRGGGLSGEQLVGSSSSYNVQLDIKGKWIYWREEQRIHRVPLYSYKMPTPQVIDLEQPCLSFVLDALANQIYYRGKNDFYRVNADGGGGSQPLGLNFNFSAGRVDSQWILKLVDRNLYWVENLYIAAERIALSRPDRYVLADARVLRLNLDTNVKETLFNINDGLTKVEELAVDLAGGKIFILDNNSLKQGNLDGTGPLTRLFTLEGGSDVTLDFDDVNNRLIWFNYHGERFYYTPGRPQFTKKGAVIKDLISFDVAR